MSDLSVTDTLPTPARRARVAVASSLGTALEWYDFFLYGTAAAVIFPALFFPAQNPLVGTMLAFGAFAVGFVVRPVGAVIFGHLGDRKSRKSVLVITLSLMGVATTAIGLLPTYETIGVAAPLLLVLLRLLQGFAVGGEWGGAVLMTAEYAPPGRRGFYSSLPGLGVMAGFLLAAGVFALTSSLLSKASLMSWGWRIPFLLSAVLVGIGLYIRLRLTESPIFSQSQQNRPEKEKLPILTVLRRYPKNILLVMGARFAENGCAYLFLVFVIAYATTQVGFSTTTILAAVAAGAAAEMFTLPAFGALSDKVGRRPVYIAGAVFLMFFAFPFFWLIQSGQTVLVYIALVLALGIGHSAMFGPQSALFAEMFGTRVRYTGLAVGHGLASVFAGGLSPLIAIALLNWTGGDPWPVAVYIIILGLITTVSIYLAQETRLVDLADDDGVTPVSR